MSTAGDVATALAPFGVLLVEEGLRRLKGETTTEEAALNALDAIATTIPRELLRAYLTPGGVERAELLADLAERAKFG